MKSCQHFTCIVAAPTFIFSMKPYWHLHLHYSCTNIGFYNEAALAPIFRSNMAQTSRVHSTIARYQEFRDANKTLKMQGLLIKILEMPTKPWSFKKNAAKTLTLQGALIKTLKMQRDANKTLKFQEGYRQDFDIAWTCPWRRDDATPTSDAGGRWHCPTFGDMMWNCTTQKGDDVASTCKVQEDAPRR